MCCRDFPSPEVAWEYSEDWIHEYCFLYGKFHGGRFDDRLHRQSWTYSTFVNQITHSPLQISLTRMEEDNIQHQIQELKHKQHIQSVTVLSQSQFQVIYSPQLTNSPYSHLCFKIKVSVSENYPEEPPLLSFLDKIYHLNIDPIKGNVHMALLSDDWSPYLTLAAVFDSLDLLLEEPDIEYPANAEIKEQYIHFPDKYMKKIEQTIKAYSSVAVISHSEAVQHVDMIIEPKSRESQMRGQFSPIVEMKEVNSLSDYQIGEQTASIPELRAVNTFASVQRKDSNIRIQTSSDIEYQPEPKIDQSVSPKIDESAAPKRIQNNDLTSNQISFFGKNKATNAVPSRPQLKNREQPRTAVRQNDIQKVPQTQFQKTQQNLRKADSMIQLLMVECDSMEQTIKRTQNARMKQKLSQKQQRVLQMLDETLELSSSLRQKLFSQLKIIGKNMGK